MELTPIGHVVREASGEGQSIPELQAQPTQIVIDPQFVDGLLGVEPGSDLVVLYFIDRARGPWGPVVLLCIILNWVVPFFVLLPRPAKRSAGVMMKVAVVVLIGRWVDLYLMVFPSTVGSSPVFGVWEVAGIGCLLATGALLALRAFDAPSQAPNRNPYLSESLHYHAG